MKLIDKIIHYGFYLFVFLLPWQTRWIFREAELNGEPWEYGRLSLYGTEILLIIIFILGLFTWYRDFRQEKLKDRYRDFKTKPHITLLLTLTILFWATLSVFWSANFIIAWSGFLFLILGAGIYWLFESQLFNLKKVSLAIIFSGIIQSIMALWQFVSQSFGASKWLGLSFLNPALGGTSVIETSVGRFLRAYGSLPHPNMLAGWLAVGILVTIILIKQESIKKFLPLYYLAAGILSLGLVLTFSRAGILALFLTLIIYSAISYFKKQSIKKLLPALLIMFFIFMISFFIFNDIFTSRLNGTERLEVKSNQQRLSYYPEAFSIIKNNWLLGVGLNNYTENLYQKNPNLNAWDYQPVHDTGILIWAELGIVGLLLFIFFIIFVFRNKSQYWPLLVAILILSCFDHYFRSLYFGIMLWWLVVGLNMKNT